MLEICSLMVAIITTATVIVLGASFGDKTEAPKINTTRTHFTDLAKATDTDTIIEMEQIHDTYYETVRELTAYLQNNSVSEDKKVYVCFLLGVYRAEDAVWALGDCITLESKKQDKKGGIPRWFNYPAKDALVRIGKAGEKVALFKLASEKNELARKLFCQVIKEIEGKKIGLIRLQDAIDAETDPVKKENLRLGLKYFTEPSSNAEKQAP